MCVVHKVSSAFHTNSVGMAVWPHRSLFLAKSFIGTIFNILGLIWSVFHEFSPYFEISVFEQCSILQLAFYNVYFVHLFPPNKLIKFNQFLIFFIVILALQPLRYGQNIGTMHTGVPFNIQNFNL